MFNPGERLKKNSQFQKVYTNGKSYVNNLLVLYVLKHQDKGVRRVGFTVSKKIGKAVRRNRVRRILREIYRLNNHKLIDGIDIVIIPRQKILGATYQQVDRAMIKLFKKAGILKNNI